MKAWSRLVLGDLLVIILWHKASNHGISGVERRIWKARLNIGFHSFLCYETAGYRTISLTLRKPGMCAVIVQSPACLTQSSRLVRETTLYSMQSQTTTSSSSGKELLSPISFWRATSGLSMTRYYWCKCHRDMPSCCCKTPRWIYCPARTRNRGQAPLKVPEVLPLPQISTACELRCKLCHIRGTVRRTVIIPKWPNLHL